MAAKNGTYVIGCNLPHGLQIKGAGKTVKLKGKNTAMIDTIHGFGITDDVPVEVWDEFARKHAQANYIKNGNIWVVSDRNSARDAAEEHKDQKTGLEQKDPKKMETKPDAEV